ncbi:MAG: diguanylate cyclase [Solirubrobacterales bacterium]|nr:diguanylate cyclase [Solirubrobacterales bacterium]
MLPSTDEKAALRVTERLRRALASDQPEEARSHGLMVTITIGAAEWRHEEMDELVCRADSALYLGKATGRDNVQVSSPFPATPRPPKRSDVAGGRGGRERRRPGSRVSSPGGHGPRARARERCRPRVAGDASGYPPRYSVI